MSWLTENAPGKKFINCGQTFVSWMCRNTPVSTAQLEWEKQLDPWNYQPFYLGTQYAESAVTAAWGRPMYGPAVIPFPTTQLGNAVHGYDGAYGSAPIDVGSTTRRAAADALAAVRGMP